MKFSFGAISSSTVKGVVGPRVVVSKATLAQMEKIGGNAGLRQAVVICKGVTLPDTECKVKVTVDGQEYVLDHSGKEFNFRVTRQSEEGLKGFEALFNKLAETPDKEFNVKYEVQK